MTQTIRQSNKLSYETNVEDLLVFFTESNYNADISSVLFSIEVVGWLLSLCTGKCNTFTWLRAACKKFLTLN